MMEGVMSAQELIAEFGEADAALALQPRAHGVTSQHRAHPRVLAVHPQELHQPHVAEPILRSGA